MNSSIKVAPCVGCNKESICKYADDMLAAFNEIAAVVNKYEVTNTNLVLQAYCKHNQPPIDIPSFMKQGVRGAE